jgi:tyrosinase
MWLNLTKLFTICTAIEIIAGQCSSPATRREIRDLSQDERTKFFNAVKVIYQNNAVGSIYSNFTATHYNFQQYAHGVPAFLPWHRFFLNQFEIELKKVDSSITIPYWDWSKDSQAPETSEIFSQNYFGGNGDSQTGCVNSGYFSGWQVQIPEVKCLQRKFNGGDKIGSWYSPAMIENLLKNSRESYDQFRVALEGSPHASPHSNIGGDMSQMYSTNDPLFFMHHAFVDLIWWEWQQRNPNLALTYNGDNNNTPDEVLIPFNSPVSSVLSTTSNGLCYQYNRWSGASNAFNSAFSQNPQSNSQKLHRRQGLLGNILNLQALPNFVNAFDRNKSDMLKYPDPIPESHITMNRLNVDKVRAFEQQNYQFTQRFNLLDVNIRLDGILNLKL